MCLRDGEREMGKRGVGGGLKCPGCSLSVVRTNHITFLV